MYTISVWNKESPNFNANQFAIVNGTETFHTDTLEEAIKMMWEIEGEHISRRVLRDHDGNKLSGANIFGMTLDMLADGSIK